MHVHFKPARVYRGFLLVNDAHIDAMLQEQESVVKIICKHSQITRVNSNFSKGHMKNVTVHANYVVQPSLSEN